MIHFFRKIRRDLIDNSKSYKYFKYGIGEIVLVVLGILIALQINNWNEEKKSDEKTKLLFSEVQKELLHNIKRTNYIIDFYLMRDSILYKVIKKKADAQDYKTNPYYKYLQLSYDRVVVEDDAFRNLLSSESSFTRKQDTFISHLKNLYGVDKLEVENYDNYTMAKARDFEKKMINEKSWYSDHVAGNVTDEMLEYFLNDPIYLNHVSNYSIVGYKLHLRTVLGFRQKSLSLYEEVSDYYDLDKDSTIIINFKNINHLTGTYIEGDYKAIISEKENELILMHYEKDTLNAELRIYPYLNKYFIHTYLDDFGENQGDISMFLYDENNKVYGISIIGLYGEGNEERPKYLKLD